MEKSLQRLQELHDVFGRVMRPGVGIERTVFVGVYRGRAPQYVVASGAVGLPHAVQFGCAFAIERLPGDVRVLRENP